MTLKTSFFKECRENAKRFLASGIALVFIGLLELILFVIELQNRMTDLQHMHETGMAIRDILGQIVEPSYGACIFAMVCGVWLAYVGFWFLHSKTQSDFYGSVPVKRSRQFGVIGLNTFLVFVIPVSLVAVVKIIVLSTAGYLAEGFAAMIATNLLNEILSFAAAWVTAVLAIILTGQWIVGLLACGVFSCYMPLVIRYLIPTYANQFFSSYVAGYRAEMSAFNYFSPASLSFGLVSDALRGRYLAAILVWIVVVGAIVFVLFQKRPAEAAGRAMTFEKLNPVIRFLIVIPMALYAGMYLMQMSMEQSIAWMLVGIFLGAVVFHGLVETIYQFNIRAALSHKKGLLASLVLCYAVLAVFYFDITGFDAWRPVRDDVKAVDVSVNSLESKDYTFWGEASEGISGDGIDTVLALMDHAQENEDRDETNGMVAVDVDFTMENGAHKKRCYWVDEEQTIDLLDQVCADEQFRENYFSLYTADRSLITKVEWDNGIEYETLRFSQKQRDEFFDIYLEDLAQMSYSELRKESPISQFCVYYEYAYYPYSDTRQEMGQEYYYIYPSFEKTIEYLKQSGVKMTDPLDYEIRQITVMKYEDDYGVSEEKYITNPEIIDKYRDEMCYLLMSGWYMNRYFPSEYSVEVTILSPNGTNSFEVGVTEKVAKEMMNE